MSEITVLGAGGWGIALALTAYRCGHKVNLWTKFEEEATALRRDEEHKKLLPGVYIPKDINITTELSIIKNSEMVIIAVPSFAVEQTAKDISGIITPNTIITNVAKGFADDEGTRLSEIIKKYNKTHEFEEKPKIAFFTGCMIDYKLPWIAEYLVKILNKLGYEVDIPEEQVCCGSPLLRTGQVELIPELVQKNYEIFKDYDTVLTVCAGCGSTLKRNYPEYGADLNVMDVSEFLDGKLNPEEMNDLNIKVTYHDPCHLIRGQGISEEPRNILKNMNGVEFIEMDKADQCCGAGGGVRSGKPEIAAALADEKVEMIDKLDVDYVVTICPFCEYNIQDSLTKNNSKVSVINMMELLNKAYE